MFENLFGKCKSFVLGLVFSVAGFAAQAADTGAGGNSAPDLSSLTNMVDFSTVITAVLAIAALLAGVYVSIKGAKTVLSMIRGG